MLTTANTEMFFDNNNKNTLRRARKLPLDTKNKHKESLFTLTFDHYCFYSFWRASNINLFPRYFKEEKVFVKFQHTHKK